MCAPFARLSVSFIDARATPRHADTGAELIRKRAGTDSRRIRYRDKARNEHAESLWATNFEVNRQCPNGLDVGRLSCAVDWVARNVEGCFGTVIAAWPP